jgi:hypothetical protein
MEGKTYTDAGEEVVDDWDGFGSYVLKVVNFRDIIRQVVKFVFLFFSIKQFTFSKFSNKLKLHSITSFKRYL